MNEEMEVAVEKMHTKATSRLEQLMAENYPSRPLVEILREAMKIDGFAALIAESLNAGYEIGYEDRHLGRGPFNSPGMTAEDFQI